MKLVLAEKPSVPQNIKQRERRSEHKCLKKESLP